MPKNQSPAARSPGARQSVPRPMTEPVELPPPPDTMLVRLKPYDPKRGYTLRTLMTPDGKKYEVDRGWYEVGAGIAERLRDFKQNVSDPEHPIAAFDVCTHEEAVAIDNRAIQTERAGAQNPVRVHSVAGRASARTVRTESPSAATGDMTTADIKGTLTAAQKAELDALDDPELDGGEEGWDKATAEPDPTPTPPRAARAGTRRTTAPEV